MQIEVGKYYKFKWGRDEEMLFRLIYVKSKEYAIAINHLNKTCTSIEIVTNDSETLNEIELQSFEEISKEYFTNSYKECIYRLGFFDFFKFDEKFDMSHYPVTFNDLMAKD